MPASRLTALWGLLLIVAGVLAFCGPAQAIVRFSWRDTPTGDSQPITGVSCPSSALCTAIDASGNVLTASDPTGYEAAWKIAHVDGTPLSAVSCPSASLCVAVDYYGGNVLTSTDPTGGATAWRSAQVDPPTGPDGPNMTAISCPSTSLCVVVDNSGNVVTSTNPTGGATAWVKTHVDNGMTYECFRYGESGNCQPGLWAVSCASISLCVATDDSGNVISSSNPAGGPSAWSGANAVTAVPASQAYIGISCPSVMVCVAVDNYAGDVFTWNPNAAASGSTAAIAADSGLSGISCQSASLCVAPGYSPRLYLSTNPTGGAPAWDTTYQGPIESSNNIGPATCPSGSFCIAFDNPGHVLLGARVPSSAQIRALLHRQLRPTGRATRISNLAKHGGYTLDFTSPSSGQLNISWYRSAGRHARRSRSALVATATAGLASQGQWKVAITLTRKGRRELARLRAVKIIAEVKFTPASEAPVTSVRTFVLNRRS